MNIETSFAPLLDLLVKSAALILLGTALLAMLRKVSAANRHAVSVAIFAGLVLLPFTKLISARWSFSIGKTATPPVIVRLPLIVSAPGSDRGESASPVEKLAPAASHTPLAISWKKLAFAGWLAGAAGLIAGRALVALRLRSIVGRSFPIEGERLAAKVRSLMATSDVFAAVRVSDECRVPLASGIARPVVLLPAEAAEWSDASISSALHHELGHIRRRDCVTRLLADLLCAFYWVNPLVWFAARQMRLAQEQSCDDLVLNAGASADEYAEQLVDVVRSLQGDRFTACHALAMAQPSTLETRVLAIVDPQRDRSARSVRGTLVGIAFASAALALCTTAQLRGAEEKNAAAVEAQRTEVVIKAIFIEFTGPGDALPVFLKRPDGDPTPALRGILSGAQAHAAVKSLGEAKGVDVLSRPQVLTLSKERAAIKIFREFRYATEWKKDTATGAWKPSIFETKNLGVSFTVTPEVNADGTILLHMQPELVEFAGFADLDGDAGKIFGKPDAAKPFGERVVAGPAGLGIPEGHRAQALFNTRAISTDVSVKQGDTVVLGGMHAADPKEAKRHLFVLVSADIAGPGGVPVPVGRLDNKRPAPMKTAGQKTTEVTSDEAVFDKKTGRIQASGNVKIEADSATITAENLAIQPEKNGPISPAEKWIVPKLEFRDATMQECVEFLTQKSKALDPQGRGINVVIKNRGGIAEMKITLSLAEIPITEALRYVAALADCELTEEKFAFVIEPKPERKVPVRNASGASVPAEPKSAALKKAGAIIFPKIDLRDATLSETVDFLREKSKALDPDKQGVNLILTPAAAGQNAKLTLSLTNVPLAEALRYVAELAGCEVAADEHAITIQGRAK